MTSRCCRGLQRHFRIFQDSQFGILSQLCSEIRTELAKNLEKDLLPILAQYPDLDHLRNLSRISSVFLAELAHNLEQNLPRIPHRICTDLKEGFTQNFKQDSFKVSSRICLGVLAECAQNSERNSHRIRRKMCSESEARFAQNPEQD